MSEALTDFEYKGYDITIHQDCDAESPREWDNVGIMVCFHRRYDLGDKHSITRSDFETWGDLEDILYDHYKALVVLPLYLYDHSGISISTNRNYPFDDRWDSFQVGFIYTTEVQVRKVLGWKSIPKAKIKELEDMLYQEVKTYDSYLRGDVYGYIITKSKKCFKCGHTNEETVDSGWGIYEIDNAIKDAKTFIDDLETKPQ